MSVSQDIIENIFFTAEKLGLRYGVRFEAQIGGDAWGGAICYLEELRMQAREC